MQPPPRVEAALAAAWQRLASLLAAQGSLLVAFSGGVDSSLLVAAARAALGDQVKAALCLGPFTPDWEVEAARGLAHALGVELLEIDAAELSDPRIAENGPQRCYWCKRRRLMLLIHLAQELGLTAVAEGSQLDDAKEDRPGAKAVAELGVLSPLAQAGLDKTMVRELSRAWNLPTADSPAAACLASRVPWGAPLSSATLTRVGQAEALLREILPKSPLRVRDHFPLARIELLPGLLARAAAEPLRGRIVEAVKAAGYEQVCLDLAGYRSGGANS
ncbi:hypothetical protein AAU61_19090 [Desulfocarbo indianensis]|nr:hypothetical protein AAU61_19090 [Desulfocarbo indianensis]